MICLFWVQIQVHFERTPQQMMIYLEKLFEFKLFDYQENVHVMNEYVNQWTQIWWLRLSPQVYVMYILYRYWLWSFQDILSLLKSMPYERLLIHCLENSNQSTLVKNIPTCLNVLYSSHLNQKKKSVSDKWFVKQYIRELDRLYSRHSTTIDVAIFKNNLEKPL